MEDLTGSNHIPSCNTAVALGLFDGLHRGHQDVIHRAVEFIPMGIAPAVFTFETHTVTSKGDGGVDVILSRDLKFELLSKLGIQYIYSPDFLNFKNLSDKEFVQMVLKDKMSAKYVICGEDFRFGKGGNSGIIELKELCSQYGIEVVIVPPTLIDGNVVSSTRIRQYIKNGEIDKANRLLGYNFKMRLQVVYGNQIGRTMNFPTINQYIPQRQIVPKFGVYVSKTVIDGKDYRSITNVGIKPTIGGETNPLAETYIIGYSGDLYGQVVEISLFRFIRPEQKFASLDELHARIKADIEHAKSL